MVDEEEESGGGYIMGGSEGRKGVGSGRGQRED